MKKEELINKNFSKKIPLKAERDLLFKSIFR
jgi:hypothetical protein